MSLDLHKISTVTVSSPVSSIDFTSIPQTYQDLVLKVSVESASSPLIYFNNATTSYSFMVLRGTGSAAQGLTNVAYAGTTNWIMLANGSPSTSDVYIPNYRSSNNKLAVVDGAYGVNSATAYITFLAGIWANTAAITTLSIGSYLVPLLANTTATLYGVL